MLTLFKICFNLQCKKESEEVVVAFFWVEDGLSEQQWVLP